MRNLLAAIVVHGMVSAVAASLAVADDLPRLVAVPHQKRVRVDGVAPVALWDTEWWLSVTASSEAGICRIDYSARFADGKDGRAVAGRLEVVAEPIKEKSGRVNIRCPARPDYDRPLRVRLQAVACDGRSSAWIESTFPVRDVSESAVGAKVASTAGATIDVVTFDAGATTTLGEVRAGLDRAARSRGANEASGLRVSEIQGDRVRFAADAIRLPPPPPDTASVVSSPPVEDILGEVAMPAARR